MDVSQTMHPNVPATEAETGAPTPPSGPRSARSRETRRRLLDSGRILFAEQGPRAITSHAIASHAGYAAGTFYLHFKDKQTLFRELALEAATELERRLAAVSVGKSDPREIVRAQAAALVGFAEEQRDLIRIVFHPGEEAADVGSRVLSRLAEGISERRREALADGRARACFEEDVLAQAIVGMWAHVLAWWTEDPSRASRDAIIQTLTHFQMHGHRAGPFAQNGAVCDLDADLAIEPDAGPTTTQLSDETKTNTTTTTTTTPTTPTTTTTTKA